MDNLDLFSLTPILRLVCEEAADLHTVLVRTPGVSEALRKRAASLQANVAHLAVTKAATIGEADSVILKLQATMESRATLGRFIGDARG